MVNVGDPMPETTLVGDDGPVKLRDRIGKTLVVYFYPKDETYGCTKEACAFRDSYEDFVAAGAEVIGISRDDAASHAGFKSHHRLPFTLLSDPDGKVTSSWGVKGPLGRGPAADCLSPIFRMARRYWDVFGHSGLVGVFSPQRGGEKNGGLQRLCRWDNHRRQVAFLPWHGAGGDKFVGLRI